MVDNSVLVVMESEETAEGRADCIQKDLIIFALQFYSINSAM